MAFIGNSSHRNQIKDDMDYVDIHGRQIRVIVSEKTGEILVPINEIREAGFNIYRRTQYNKTLIDDGQLSKEFDMYLLDCAKTYILKNRVTFNEAQILQSIDRCKQALIGNKKVNPTSNSTDDLIGNKKVNTTLNSTDDFFKDRVVHSDSDGFQIQITQENKSPSGLTQKNVHNHNKRFSSNFDNGVTSFDKSSLKSPSLLNTSFEQSNGLQNCKENTPELPKFHNDNQNKKQQNSYTLRSPNCNKNEILEKLHNTSSSSSESSTINKSKLKCTAVLEIAKIYPVVVTFVEPKETVAWVQDAANKSILEEIFDRVNREARKQTATTPTRGKTYAALDDDYWYRCKVVKVSPLTVFFIDYGNTVEVDEVRPISDDLIKIPQQGIRISFKNATIKPEEEIEISPITRFDDGTYYVKVIKESIRQQNCPQKQFNQQKIDNNVKAFECFDLPPALENLEDHATVRIDKLRNNRLTLRTKNSCTLLTEIYNKLSTVQPERLKNVKINQLVLYKNDEDGRYYRAQIRENVDKDCVKIEYLDHYDEDIVPKQSIFAITEELSKFKLSYVPIEQFTFIEQPLNIQQEDYVNNLIEQKTKFAVILNNNRFDLNYNDENKQQVKLFEKLKQSIKPVKKTNITRLSDLKKTDLQLGIDKYMCSSLEGSNVTIIQDQDAILAVMKTTVDSDEPYEPEEGEVCLGLFEDNWFRCVIRSVKNNRYDVQFIDYGNTSTLTSTELRKLSNDMKKIPILGYSAKIVGVPKQRENELNQLINDGETYDIDVKRCNNGVYEIEIPI